MEIRTLINLIANGKMFVLASLSYVSCWGFSHFVVQRIVARFRGGPAEKSGAAGEYAATFVIASLWWLAALGRPLLMLVSIGLFMSVCLTGLDQR